MSSTRARRIVVVILMIGSVFSQLSVSGRAAAADDGLRRFFGTWRTHVTGGTWITPGPTQDYDRLNISAGGPEKALTINADGTYVWEAYGGKKGQWVAGDASYPIVLIDIAENKRWKVGVDSKHTGGREIVIWDGKFYTYDGKR